MQASDFGHQASGWLAEIPEFCGATLAFHPNPLPPAWEFPNHLWPLLNRANKSLMLLEGIGRTLPNPTPLYRRLSDREAIFSSRMEGTYASPRQLLLYELDPRDPESEDRHRNQHREVANYARAMRHAAVTAAPTGLPLVRELHAVLMDGVRGEDKQPGQFRSRQVGIGASGARPRFVPPPPDRLQDYLEDFNTYLHRDTYQYDPLVECFIAHYQLETIHPFNDGNGRVGRLLLTLMIQRLCEMKHPWLHMSGYFEKDKQAYCDLMYRVSSRGEWSEWIAYCLRGVVEQAADTTLRCERLLGLRDQFYQRLEATKGKLRLKTIVDRLFDRPIMELSKLSLELEVTYPTAKSDVEKLVELGILAELPGHYPKAYYPPELFAIAYEGLE